MTIQQSQPRSIILSKVKIKLLGLIPGLFCLSILSSYPILKLLSQGFDSTYLQIVEKRDPSPFPKRTYFSAWLRKDNYKQLSRFIDDRLPFRGLAIQVKQQFEQSILGETRFPRVDIGKENWLYYRWSYGLESNATGDSDWFEAERITYGLENLQSFIDWQERKNKTVRVVVLPNKHTIYPEYLPGQAKKDLTKTQNARQLLYRWFEVPQDINRVNLWSAYRSAKVRSPQLLYYPEDTHHSSWGSIIMMQSLIQSLSPKLWQDKDIQQLVGESDWGQDLKTILGHLPQIETIGFPLFRLFRPDSIPESITIKGQKFTSFAEAEASGLLADRRNIIRVDQTSDNATVLPGRTLIIRDSFIGLSQQESLAHYFESVDYIHAKEISQRFIQKSLGDYDTIIIAVVERNILSFLEKLPRYLENAVIPEKKSVLYQGDGDFRLVGEVGEKTNISIQNKLLYVTSRKPKPFIRIQGFNLRPDRAYKLRMIVDSPQVDRVTLTYRSQYQPRVKETLFSSLLEIELPLKKGRNDLSFFLQTAKLRSPWKIQFEGGETTYKIESLEIFELPE